LRKECYSAGGNISNYGIFICKARIDGRKFRGKKKDTGIRGHSAKDA
jgi:hypothetical protein